MKSFVFPNPDDNKRIAIASIVDDSLNPFEKIHPEGFYLTEGTYESQWFECYDIENKTIKINLDRAREKTRQRLRSEREPLLQKLDVKFQRSLEVNLKPNPEIINEKQRLRDITKTVDNCNSLEELSSLKCQ